MIHFARDPIDEMLHPSLKLQPTTVAEERSGGGGKN
jgi:hypothetical protein